MPHPLYAPRKAPQLAMNKYIASEIVFRKSSAFNEVHLWIRYGLDSPVIESRWGARFSAPFQTGPSAHPASYTIDTGSLPGVKRPGRGVDHPPQSSAEVKERVELYLYFFSGPSWTVLGWTLPLSYTYEFLPLRFSSEKSERDVA